MKLKPELVRELVHYEPEAGKFFLKRRSDKYFKNANDAFMWNHRNEGREILIPDPKSGDYVNTSLMGQHVLAHQLAWVLVHGKWPEGPIDHINGVKYDNRLCNLRVCHAAENQRNMVKFCTNTSGESNVQITEYGTYQVVVARKSLGTFKTMAEAVEVRDKYLKANGFTGRHGKQRIVATPKPPYRVMKKIRREEIKREARQALQSA